MSSELVDESQSAACVSVCGATAAVGGHQGGCWGSLSSHWHLERIPTSPPFMVEPSPAGCMDIYGAPGPLAPQPSAFKSPWKRGPARGGQPGHAAPTQMHPLTGSLAGVTALFTILKGGDPLDGLVLCQCALGPMKGAGRVQLVQQGGGSEELSTFLSGPDHGTGSAEVSGLLPTPFLALVPTELEITPRASGVLTAKLCLVNEAVSLKRLGRPGSLNLNASGGGKRESARGGRGRKKNEEDEEEEEEDEEKPASPSCLSLAPVSSHQPASSAHSHVRGERSVDGSSSTSPVINLRSIGMDELSPAAPLKPA
ncbi:unnamed protein product [Pleuronectes platessa]|uniref:Uncharacterized protein n=1 Tax=Pleuronectes platessa TaxID=8262 RepID=A0A9N7U9R1_PLEPL|nr:unnamed protein product [Pleuronectes platessa]